MSKSQNTLTSPVSITVTASTDNPNDEGYHHCFEQKEGVTLTFEVDIDSPVDNISFVLWNLYDPVNPVMAKSMDSSVQNGHATITISHHLDGHLGPGPYCATLTASTTASDASTGGRMIVGNAIYYYDTWEGSRNCKYH